MAIHLAQVAIDSQTGLLEDRMINTFHFDGSGPDYENIVDMLDDFYNVIAPGNSASIVQQMANEAVGTNLTVTIYDLSDPVPRAPVFTQSRTLVSPSSTDMLPAEVALCLSYNAEPLSGVPQARRRGRIYLGGFNTATDSNGRPATAVRLIVARAAKKLLVDSNASVSWEWVVYSRTAGTASEVVGGWVDDAWDTQRRRGWAPTTRQAWTAIAP